MTELSSSGRHITDEELLLDYYGESPASNRQERQEHLDTCEACRALDRELRSVLALVDSTPAVEAPPGFGREMWARLEPQISARVHRNTWWRPAQWALAAGIASLVIGSFFLGRVWDNAPRKDETVQSPESNAAVADFLGPPERGREGGSGTGMSERLLRTEVEDHLERSQRVFVDLVNADDASRAAFDGDRTRAADLVAAGRLYRRSAETFGDVEMRDLLEDVERVLVDVANGPPGGSSKDLTDVRTRITDQDLIFRLRLAASEIREHERRVRPTW